MDMCFTDKGTHKTTNMSFPGWGKNITSDICFPRRGIHGYLSQVGEHISLKVHVSPVGKSLGICVSQVRKHISLGIRVSQVGEHISLGICVSQVGEHISLMGMSFPTWDLRLIRIHSNDRKYFYVYLGMLMNLLLLLFLLGHHRSPELLWEIASFCFGVLKNLLITYIHLWLYL